MTYVLCVRKCGVGYGWRVEYLRVVCLVCTARPSDFVLDKDAATRGFVTHLDLKCGENPTAFFVMAGDSFMGHDSSFSTCRVHYQIQ